MDHSVGGVRVRRSLMTQSKREADRRALAVAADLELGGTESWRCGSLRVAPLIRRYLDQQAAGGTTPRRIRARERVLELGLARCPTLRRVTAQGISAGLDAAAVAYRWAPSTVNCYREILSAFCGWLLRQGLLRVNPAQRIPRRPVPPRVGRRALTRLELQRLLAGSPLRRASCYAVAVAVGLRRCELARLEWADVDLDAGVVSLRADATKERRAAVLPLSAWVVGWLTRWRVFCSRGGGVWPAVPHHSTFRRDLLRAGIRPRGKHGSVDLHALRVTCATLLAQSGVGVPVTQRIMRHRDPRVTLRIYTKLQDADLRAGVDAVRLSD